MSNKIWGLIGTALLVSGCVHIPPIYQGTPAQTAAFCKPWKKKMQQTVSQLTGQCNKGDPEACSAWLKLADKSHQASILHKKFIADQRLCEQHHFTNCYEAWQSFPSSHTQYAQVKDLFTREVTDACNKNDLWACSYLFIENSRSSPSNPDKSYIQLRKVTQAACLNPGHTEWLSACEMWYEIDKDDRQAAIRAVLSRSKAACHQGDLMACQLSLKLLTDIVRAQGIETEMQQANCEQETSPFCELKQQQQAFLSQLSSQCNRGAGPWRVCQVLEHLSSEGEQVDRQQSYTAISLKKSCLNDFKDSEACHQWHQGETDLNEIQRLLDHLYTACYQHNDMQACQWYYEDSNHTFTACVNH